MTGERDSLVGKRVTVIGLGIEGVDAARYAVAHGADVAVLDSKPKAALISRLDELEGCWMDPNGRKDVTCHDDCGEPESGPGGSCLKPDCPCKNLVPLALIRPEYDKKHTEPATAERATYLYEPDQSGRRRPIVRT